MTKQKQDDGLVIVEKYGDFELTRKQGKNKRWRWQIRKGAVFGAFGPVTGDLDPAKTDAAGRVYFDALRKAEKVTLAEAAVEKAKNEVVKAVQDRDVATRLVTEAEGRSLRIQRDLDKARFHRNLVAVLTVAAFIVAIIATAENAA